MDAQEILRAKLSELWQSKRSLLLDRVATLQNAINSLPDLEQESAVAAAHNLAGVLGSFGLKRGTEIARKFELAFAENPTPANAEYQSQLDELRSLIENHTL